MERIPVFNRGDSRLRGNGKKLKILFDGVCNFCNFWVDFILKRDRKDKFRFGMLQNFSRQDSKAQRDNLETVILVQEGKTYEKSTAVLRILKEVGGVWKLFYVFILVPKFIRDFIYNIVARNRYKWFGQREACRLPTEEERKKFL
jgi:predicted DCC family thiol-disulfide oxidoreductase YuxK